MCIAAAQVQYIYSFMCVVVMADDVHLGYTQQLVHCALMCIAAAQVQCIYYFMCAVVMAELLHIY
jgi:hypothetical protein